ncbi:MAG: hypothetical protein F2870_02425, partial [Actinobacteria bacterium]|nr:hypothetical protein [Actinomycetota bacterium]
MTFPVAVWRLNTRVKALSEGLREGISMSLLSWKLHGTGKTIGQGEVVSTDERLSWPRTIGV